jgi:small subunit ribosomal protein S8
VPGSKFKREIVRVLHENHFIRGFAEQAADPRPLLHIRLQYTPSQEPVFRGLRRISRPGLRRYADCEEIRSFNRRMGLVIVSTSRGVMSGEQAVAEGIGGELLCQVW